MKQLTLEDVVGSFDYAAKSIAEKFLNRDTSVITTYEVHFYDKEEKQRIDWFEGKTEVDAKGAAIAEHGRIRIIKIVTSARTLAEIMALD